MSSKSSSEGPQRPSPGKRLEITIEKLAVGGNGVGRHEGFVLFVPFSAPGDRLLVEVVETKAQHGIAEIVEIPEASSDRVQAPCPYYFECGGCNWQHLSKESQLHQKEDIVKETLSKFLKMEVPILPIIASPQAWRYRNRIQLAVQGEKLGFRKRRSHDVIDIMDCLITEETLTQSLPKIRKTLRPTDQRIELFLNSKHEAVWEKFDSTGESVGFAQVNRFQNETIINTVRDWVLPERKNILELYAGSGNFTWPLAEKFPDTSLVAVEMNPLLVERAQRQKKTFPKVQYFASDAESFVRRWNLTQHDLIFLDPPRQGSTEYIMNALAWASAPQILYLSCHPVSLARDLRWFFAANSKNSRRYKIHRVQPFEMFPQTDHVETLVELRVD